MAISGVQLCITKTEVAGHRRDSPVDEVNNAAFGGIEGEVVVRELIMRKGIQVILERRTSRMGKDGVSSKRITEAMGWNRWEVVDDSNEKVGP